MPGFGEQFGVLAIADGLPARRLNFLDELRRHDLVGGISAQPVDARTQRAERAERTDCVRRRGIHHDVLRRARCVAREPQPDPEVPRRIKSTRRRSWPAGLARSWACLPFASKAARPASGGAMKQQYIGMSRPVSAPLPPSISSAEPPFAARAATQSGPGTGATLAPLRRRARAVQQPRRRRPR